MSWQELNPVATEPKLQQSLHDDVLEYCQQLSSAILRAPASREYSDLIGLGGWLRKNHLIQLLAPYREQGLKPLGKVFHSAPANVDSLFVYSAILSLLCGNINLIRLSSRSGGSSALLVQHLNDLARSFPEISARLKIVKCPHDHAELDAWIEQADGRILWGSNKGITAMRAKPFPAHARDISFAHKHSIALLGAQAVNTADDKTLDALCKDFIKDNLLFSQQACSSAKTIAWFGSVSDTSAAKKRFWQNVMQHLAHDDLQGNEHYRALNTAQVFSMTRESTISAIHLDRLIQADISQLTDAYNENHPGCGLFLQLHVQRLSELNAQLDAHHQTMTYWGIDISMLKTWYASVLKGIDRLVPLGKALEFSPVWDGIDLIHALSRKV